MQTQTYSNQHTIIKKQFSDLLLKNLQYESKINFKNQWNSFSAEYGYSKSEINYNDLENYFNNIFNMEYIGNVLDKNFEEIIIHGHDNFQFFPNEKLMHLIKPINREDFELSLTILCLKNNIDWNIKTPFSSFKYKRNELNYRVSLMHASLTPNNQPKIFIRKIRTESFEIESFIDDEGKSLINNLIINKSNIIVAGATGSGKTTLLKSILAKTDKDEHLIIMEDTQEININSHKNITHMLSKNIKSYSLKDFCSYALRMRPDRMVLGELRSVEVIPFFLTMNNGHKGFMSTIHADSAKNAVDRLALLFKMYSEQEISYTTIMKLLCSNIDYIIYVKDKKVSTISRILGNENETIFFDEIYSNEN